MTSPVVGVVSSRSRIRVRRASAADWDRVNPVLLEGEPGLDQTNNMLKFGDGFTRWRDLDFLTPPKDDEGPVSTGDPELDAIMNAHIFDATPHPSYDDGPSLLLLYQNAKV